MRVDLCLDWPGHEEYRWSNWARGEWRVPSHWTTPLYPYQGQLVERFGQQATPSRTSHSCKLMKSLKCQLELTTEAISTQSSLPLSLPPHGLWMQHMDAKATITQSTRLSFLERSLKTSADSVTSGLSLLFLNLNFVAIDRREMSPTSGRRVSP